jgi:hypothetical protein
MDVKNVLFSKAVRSLVTSKNSYTPGVGAYNLRDNSVSKTVKNSKVQKRLRRIFCNQLQENMKKKKIHKK